MQQNYNVKNNIPNLSGPGVLDHSSPKLFDTGITFSKPYGTGIVLDYAQLYAKPHNIPLKPFNFLPACSMGFVKGECEGGHHFAKLLLCGKEWCPDCGADGSAVHKRRISRWWGKVMSMEQMGYLVLTVPPQIRESFKNQVVLSAFRTYVKRYLQRQGYERGLVRYHWAGDDGKIWHPHLNILLEGGFMSPKEMRALKRDLGRYFKKMFPQSLKGKTPKINAWYSYANPKAEGFERHKIHKLKYILRSTLTKIDVVRNAKDKELAKVLKGFRTTSTWGKWPKDKENTSELAALESGKCPHKECCKPLKWEGGRDNIVKINDPKWSKTILKPIDGGYYEIMGVLPDPPE